MTLKAITFALVATFLYAGTASAARPTTLANTVWTLQTNLEITTLTITTQGGPGAPGSAVCRVINGHFENVNVKIRGFFCPLSGKVFFVHRNLDSGDAVRVFSGSVSDKVTGQPLSMAGTMSVLISAFGDLGDYNFSATTN
ncbi:MAG TPA: hypothetical protein VFS23_34420 [Vicinamibacterales bacterium]|nr:hypothetical protein [Vicinamibacterales bacterium]